MDKLSGSARRPTISVSAGRTAIRIWFHKIDPNVDAERQYVSKSLNHTGRVEVLGYVMPSDARTTARTTTGEQFYTDGRVLVMKVVPKNSARPAADTTLR